MEPRLTRWQATAARLGLPSGRKGLALAAFSAGFLLLAVALWALQSQVPVLLEGKGNSILQGLVSLLYPHLLAEQNRLGADFMVEKAGQMALRAMLAAVLLPVFYWLWHRQKVNWQFSPRVFPMVFFGWVIASVYYCKDIWPDLLLRSQIAALYEPVGWLRWLLPQFPSFEGWLAIYAIHLAAAMAALVWVRMRVVAAYIVLAMFWVEQLALYSFGKVDHTYASFNYLGLVVPLLALPAVASNSLLLGRLLVAICYFFPFIEKFMAAGFGWASAETITGYLNLQETEWGLALAADPALAALFAWLGLVFQGLFITVMLWPRLSPLYMVFGIFFHLLTWLLLGAGSIDSPWIAALVLAYLFRPQTSAHHKPAE